MLQKFQRNQIFEAIKSVGLDPGQFDLVDSGSEVTIKHKWSASCFIVKRESAYYVGQSLVGTVRFGQLVPLVGRVCCHVSVCGLKKSSETSTRQTYGLSFSGTPS
jgi:hypothetical protein